MLYFTATKENIDPKKDIDEEIYTYIYNGSRCAIAHASLDKSVANPDDPRDIEKITMARIIMKALAEQYIKDELNIKTKRCLDIERYQANIPLFKYLQKSKLTL